MYIIDENFINSIKVLVSATEIKKQWLGYLLISKTFDPKLCYVDEALFAKNINIFLNAISNTINKHEIFSDISVVAIRAF